MKTCIRCSPNSKPLNQAMGHLWSCHKSQTTLPIPHQVDEWKNTNEKSSFHPSPCPCYSTQALRGAPTPIQRHSPTSLPTPPLHRSSQLCSYAMLKNSHPNELFGDVKGEMEEHVRYELFDFLSILATHAHTH